MLARVLAMALCLSVCRITKCVSLYVTKLQQQNQHSYNLYFSTRNKVVKL